jgi:hypothetical protein
MVLAIAALLLHLGSAPDTRSVVDTSAAPKADSTKTDPTTPASSPAPSAAGLKPASNSPNSETYAAENTQSFSNIRLPEPQPGKPLRLLPVENTPSRRNWLILSVVQHGAATFDAYSTRQAIESGAREDDPLMRPLAHSPAMYLASQISPLALDYAARRMQLGQHAFLRRSWWLPQSTSTALFIFCGAHNLRVSRQP